MEILISRRMVWEWVKDWYDGTRHVRSSYRSGYAPGSTSYGVGFRVARNP
jgi:formylglycine-generating enzyme required for sulfatase activity